MRRATRLVTNSALQPSGRPRAIVGVDPARVTVVHHGVPDPFGELPGRAARAARADGRRSSTSRNLDRKGLRPFVRGGGAAARRRVRARREAGTTRLRRASCAARRRPNVTLTGWVEQDELDDWLRRAAVYVQASRHEGFGMSVAEAMLAGCMPVTTRAGALPEVVDDVGVRWIGQRPGGGWPRRSSRRSRMDEPSARARRGRGCVEHFPLEVRGRGPARGRHGDARRARRARRWTVNLFSDTQTRPTAGDAAGDGERRGGRRAALRRPDRERAPGAGRRAARKGGGALPAVRARCATRSRSGCTAPRRRRGDPRPHRAPGPVRGRRAGGAVGRDGAACSTATEASSPRPRWRRRCGRPATATARARGSCRSSRRPTSAAGGSGRSRASTRSLGRGRPRTACAPISTARG